MTENEKLIKDENEAIEVIKSNMPTSGYYMLKESLDMAIKALEEVQEYRRLGMVEEVREAVEKTKAKKTVVKVREDDLKIGHITFKAGTRTHWCPECEKPVSGNSKYCPSRGQRLEW